MENINQSKKADPSAMPKYKTILLDPPLDIMQLGKNKGAIKYYDLMTIDQIKALPIPDLLEDSGHVWLWCTNNSLEYGYQILRHWGLTPRSIFTYCKLRMSMGSYLRNCTEPLLLATRGKAPICFNGQPNYAILPVLDHSHKPEETMEMIERCSLGPYLELFARRKRFGWDIWGNEVESDIVIPRFPVPYYSAKALKKYGKEAMIAAARDPVIKDLGKNKKVEVCYE